MKQTIEVHKFKIIILVGLVIALTGVYALGKFNPAAAQPRVPQTTSLNFSSREQPPAAHKITGVNLGDAIAGDVPLGQQQQGLRVPILMYHHVGPLLAHDPVARDLTVGPEDFEQQVIYFTNLGYHAVTIKQIYDSLNDGAPLPSRPIAFTFDDGYQDVFTYAVPVLKKYHLVGSFAIATELLGRPNYAVWDNILAAQRQGMEIISHTENHLDLSWAKYSDDDLRREIFGSKQVLEKKLGHPVDFFVYPYGHHNAKVEELVREAGYKMALTTDYGLKIAETHLLTEPRVRVHGQDGLAKLKKIFSPIVQPVSSRPNP